MPDPQTPNLGLYVPLNGADVGTWDVPMNANFNKLDSIFGAATSIAVTNVDVTLSAAQYDSTMIVVSGANTGDLTLFVPVGVGRVYRVYNSTGNPSFYVRVCTVASTRWTCVLPGEVTTIWCDGTDTRFVGLPPIGAYVDIAASAVPRWITASSPNPFLNCDGSAFNAATYPYLLNLLPGGILPDARGRFRAPLNQGTSRLSGAGVGGIDGNTFLAGGGTVAIAQGNIPAYSLTVTDPGHLHTMGGAIAYYGGTQGVDAGTTANVVVAAGATPTTAGNTTGITVNSGGSGNAFCSPGYIGGLTLVRAG